MPRNTITNEYGHFAIIPTRLIRDPNVSANARTLYGIIWTYSGDADRDAFPGRRALAADLGVSLDTVDRAIKELVNYGALAVDHAFDGDRQTSNIYRILVLPNLEEGAAPMRPGGRTHAADGGRTHAAQDQEPEDQEPEDQETPLNPPLDLGIIEPTPPTIDDLFDQFWQAWPRKEAKKTARKAFTNALAAVTRNLRDAGLPMSRRSPTPEDAAAVIVAAATWWASHWRDVEHRPLDRIPHPSTWLNGERWTDARPNPAQLQQRPSGAGESPDERARRIVELAGQLPPRDQPARKAVTE